MAAAAKSNPPESNSTAPTPLPAEPRPPAGPTEAQPSEGDVQRLTLLQKIGRLSGAEKIQLALKGTSEERFILVRDSNKSVARTVLDSPKISEHEIEAYASLHDI